MLSQKASANPGMAATNKVRQVADDDAENTTCESRYETSDTQPVTGEIDDDVQNAGQAVNSMVTAKNSDQADAYAGEKKSSPGR
jgi:hypothetical protein